MGVLLISIYPHITCILGSLRGQIFTSLGTGVINSCELIYGFWDSNSSPLQEQEMVLTTEQSLQLQKAVPKLSKPSFDGVLGLQQLDNVRKECLLAETQMFPCRTALSFLTIICWQCCGESIKWNSSYASVSQSKASLECCALAEHHRSVVDFFSRVVLMIMLSTEI